MRTSLQGNTSPNPGKKDGGLRVSKYTDSVFGAEGRTRRKFESEMEFFLHYMWSRENYFQGDAEEQYGLQTSGLTTARTSIVEG